MTRLVNSRADGDHTSIMRGTPFGNPIALDRRCSECGATHRRADDDAVSALLCYSALLIPRLTDDLVFRRQVQALEGQTLACVCPSYTRGVRAQGNHCHGDILVAYIDGYSERVAGLCDARRPTAEQSAHGHESGMVALLGHVEWMRSLLPAQRAMFG